ncbi:MAG: hypothetical protein QOI88_643 [Gammaproteobacteria bacterium]|jgi:hypothetical protein|nr:hypothetical protein [Gammaproteobacteria bacterium]
MPKKNESRDWSGHKPATSAVLLDVITTAATGSAQVSRADRVLFTACEFWASARNSSLLGQLSEEPMTQLRAAEAAFTVIGLRRAADIVQRGRMALMKTSPPVALKVVADSIERELATLDEPVDQMIADFANKQALNRQ